MRITFSKAHHFSLWICHLVDLPVLPNVCHSEFAQLMPSSIPLFKILTKKRTEPGWLSRLRVWFRFRSWSHSSWVRAVCRALCWQLRAWTLLRILCLPLSLCPSPAWALSLSLSLSKINTHKKIFFKKKEKDRTLQASVGFRDSIPTEQEFSLSMNPAKSCVIAQLKT